MSRINDLPHILSRTRVEGECWLWLGSKTERGYGRVSVKGRLRPAHVAVYEFSIGPVSSGLELDHLCRNHSCVNPAHLEPVTHKVNVLRGTSPAAKHAIKTHCPAGHPYSPENTSFFDGGRRRCRICVGARNRVYMQTYQRPPRKSRAKGA